MRYKGRSRSLTHMRHPPQTGAQRTAAQHRTRRQADSREQGSPSTTFLSLPPPSPHPPSPPSPRTHCALTHTACATTRSAALYLPPLPTRRTLYPIPSQSIHIYPFPQA
ncbi:hypothetical protein CALCODRAFT_119108 [Calocera cornea HHB12733]|uniref:Uncharacterized protein n=1 Tax=Calocera cornea HHB12733 TaxID=1353952 RepID=A0A165IE40_9BASI|nr:hypothetical protein CALCODRAFT_119108 [Calocera cornea HHB12733]